MKIVTVAQMVAIEKASDAAGHSYDAMMELAGQAVAAAALRHMRPWDSQGGTLVLAGPGNNGGDGLVAARFLRQWEPKRAVAVYAWKRKPDQNGNYDALRRLKIPIVHAEKDPDFAQLRELLLESDLVVDALLGTGVSRPIEGTLAQLLRAVQQGLSERQEEETWAAEDDERATVDLANASAALQPVGDFDFLRWPAYRELSLPQIVAVDCPSGLNCDTGRMDPAALAANLTVTFANPKMGHFIADGPRACGRLVVADIGTDPGLADDVQLVLATPAHAGSLLPTRPVDAHKGTFGKAMIVAGSVNYTGAAYLASAAAYRVGAGLVTCGVLPSLHPVLASNSVETTWLLLPEQQGVISPKAVDVVKRHLDGYAALLVGPGLTQELEAVQFVHQLLGAGDERRRMTGFMAGGSSTAAEEATTTRKPSSPDQQADASGPAMGFLSRHYAAEAAPSMSLSDVPLVLDADALNALARVDNWPSRVPVNSILTPHPGEMARLCSCSTEEIQADRIAMARSKASQWNQVVLLKGAYSVVAAPDGRAVVLPFANPALATAGSGDVLAGAIVGLLSQGLAPFEAAVLAGYLHGLAGELVRNDLGEAGTLAGDLLTGLPIAIRQLESI